MDWIIEQQLEIGKLLTVANQQQNKIKLLESQIGNVESELPEPKFPHPRLGFLCHLTQRRFAVIALARPFLYRYSEVSLGGLGNAEVRLDE